MWSRGWRQGLTLSILSQTVLNSPAQGHLAPPTPSHSSCLSSCSAEAICPPAPLSIHWVTEEPGVLVTCPQEQGALCNSSAPPKDHPCPASSSPLPASFLLLGLSPPALWAHLTPLLSTTSLVSAAVNQRPTLLFPPSEKPELPVPRSHNHTLAGLQE